MQLPIQAGWLRAGVGVMLHLLVALGSARVDVLLNQTENATASHGRERLSPAEQVGWTLFGLVLGGAFLINAALNYDPNYKIETTEYVEVDVDANEDSLDPFIAGTDTDSCSDAPYSSDSDNSCKPALRAPLLRRAPRQQASPPLSPPQSPQSPLPPTTSAVEGNSTEDDAGANLPAAGWVAAPAEAKPGAPPTAALAIGMPGITAAKPAVVRGFARVRVGLSRVPAESGGIALNLAGMGSWLSGMCEVHPFLLPAFDVGSVVVVSLALVIILAIFLQALLHNAHLRGELQKPKQCGSLGGLLMGFTLCCSYARFLPGVGHELPFALVHAAGSLQLGMLVWYLYWTSRKRSPPVPYWFPATVGIGMVGIAGSKVGMAPWLQRAALWVSAVLCLCEWPWITARCSFSDRIAPAPSIFIHAAPISLVSLVYMEVVVAPMISEGSDLPPSAVAGGHFFLAATTSGALVTLFFAYRRRAILRRFVLSRSVGFVHQEWAALTFPLVATSTYALLYAARVAPDFGGGAAQTAARVWATALGIVTLVVVGTIDLFYLLVGLPQWILYTGLPPVPGPPPLSDSALPLTGEKACCKCWPPFGGRVPTDEVAPSVELARRAVPHRSSTLYGVQLMMADAIPTDSPTESPHGSPRAVPHRTSSLHGVQLILGDAIPTDSPTESPHASPVATRPPRSLPRAILTREAPRL